LTKIDLNKQPRTGPCEPIPAWHFAFGENPALALAEIPSAKSYIKDLHRLMTL